jgi:hypothetical protein
MGGPNDKIYAHYAFVAAATILLAVSCYVSTSPSTLASDNLAFASAVDVLEGAVVTPLPDIFLVFIVGPQLPPPRDDAWVPLQSSWPQHVRLASARHWDSAQDDDLPASPDEALKPEFDSSEGFQGNFELVALCWPGLETESRPALVLGSNRRAWAYLPCDRSDAKVSGAVAAVGRALGATVFNESYATHCEDSECLRPTASGGAQAFHVAAFELAVEGPSSISRWPFGAGAAAFLNPALKKLLPALRLRVTSRVTLMAPLATVPNDEDAPSVDVALPAGSASRSVSDKESTSPSMRSATLGDLASALVHGPASSLAPRDQFIGEEMLMYTVAVLPESKQPQLVFRNSDRSGTRTLNSAQQSNMSPTNGSVSSVLHVNDRFSTTVVVFHPLDDLCSNASGVSHPNPKLPGASLAPIFEVFLSRLRSGLGLPPESVCPSDVDADVLLSCSLPVEGFRDWEVDLVARSVLKR